MPSRPHRRILLCVTGLSPQVITETLYALATGHSFVPDEIHVITTHEGAERVRLSLLDPDAGHYFALCQDYADYGLDAERIRFGAQTLHIIAGADRKPLDDIRSEADNAAAADTIMAVVRELTGDPDNTVHASIAGGRKTMGFYLGYAMSLFGREQDRLSHVLVTPPFESLGEFYFKPRKGRRIELPRENRYLHTDDAEITLADIPFVRLRGHLDRGLLTDGANYSDTVRRTQRSLGPAELVLDTASRTVRCGDETITLAPTLFAFYAWFVRRLLAGNPGIHWSQKSAADEFLAEYAAVVSEYSGDYEDAERSLDYGMTREFFDPKKAKINELLRNALGPATASDYLIQNLGKLPKTRYQLHGLTLRPEQVRFGVVE